MNMFFYPLERIGVIFQSIEEIVEQIKQDPEKFAKYHQEVLDELQRARGVNDAMYVRIQMLEGHDKVTIQ